jgi:hypothetical protein
MTTHWKLVMIGAELTEYIPIYRKRTGMANHRHQGCWMVKQMKILSISGSGQHTGWRKDEEILPRVCHEEIDTVIGQSTE